jgi:hypothetical protein
MTHSQWVARTALSQHTAWCCVLCAVEWHVYDWSMTVKSLEGTWGHWNEHWGVGFPVGCGWAPPMTMMMMVMMMIMTMTVRMSHYSVVCWAVDCDNLLRILHPHNHPESLTGIEIKNMPQYPIRTPVMGWNFLVDACAPFSVAAILPWVPYTRIRVLSLLVWNTPHMALYGISVLRGHIGHGHRPGVGANMTRLNVYIHGCWLNVSAAWMSQLSCWLHFHFYLT